MPSTFYVLPAREVLAKQFARFLNDLFPGLDLSANSPADLADNLTSLAESQYDVFVVHRDELAESDGLELALVRDFGAEKNDLVVEVGNAEETPPVPSHLWRITLEVEFDESETAEEELISELDEAINDEEALAEAS